MLPAWFRMSPPRVTYMDMVTASVGTVALGNPHMVATLSVATMEELAEEDLAEGCPKWISYHLPPLRNKADGCPETN